MDEQQRYRNALAQYLVSEKDQRPYWETDHRGMVLPLVKSGYNNSVSYGMPGILAGSAWGTLDDILRGRMVEKGEIMQGASDAAGAAMTGSLAMTRPSGSIGSGGRLANELPMDQASRMARAKEMGFDTETTFYHGTDKAFDKFRPSAYHEEFGQRIPHIMGKGVYLTKDEKVAGEYGSRVMDLLVRGKVASIADVPESLKGNNYFRDHKNGARWARENGYDGFYMNDPSELVVFDPKNIRSVKAAFDPEKTDSANLLAANAPTSAASPLVNYLLQYYDEKNR